MLTTSARSVLGIATLVATATAALAAGSLKVDQLRCEYKTDPIGIDVSRPRLSWVLVPTQPSQRGLKQTAYQILVASSAADSRPAKADLWDSGKVASDQSVNVEYAGTATRVRPRIVSGRSGLGPGRASMRRGAASGRWTMGLLKPEDWQALDRVRRGSGIGGRASEAAAGAADLPGQPLDLDRRREGRQSAGGPGAFPQGDRDPGGPQSGPGDVPDRRRRRLHAVHQRPRLGQRQQLEDSVRPGRDGPAAIRPECAWRSRSPTAARRPAPAGLMGKLVVLFDSGAPLVVPIDETWRSSRTPGERWKWADYDDAAWTPSSAIAKHGDQPWGELKLNVVKILPAAYLRKSFSLDKPLRRALLFASALGVYELHLNGQPLNTDVLSPGWTDYRKRVHYFGYDVTEPVETGRERAGRDPGRRLVCGLSGLLRPAPLLRRQAAVHRPAATGFRGWHQPGDRHRRHLEGGSRPRARGRPADGLRLRRASGNARLERGRASDDAVAAPRPWTRSVKANLEAHPGTAHPADAGTAGPARSPNPSRASTCSTSARTWSAGCGCRPRAARARKWWCGTRRCSIPTARSTPPTCARPRPPTRIYLDGGPKRDYEPYFTFHGFQYVEVTGLDYQPEPGRRDRASSCIRTCPARARSNARSRSSTSWWKTRSGARKATSWTCPPIARSATSGPAGRATPRCS